MNILIFAAGGIGDVLMTTPMFRAIKKQFPYYNITVIVMGPTQHCLVKNNNHVDEVINLSSKKWVGLSNKFRLILLIRKKNFRFVFFNHISDRPIFFALALFGKIKNRIGLDKSSVARNNIYQFYSKILTRVYQYEFNTRRRTELNLMLLRELNINDNDCSYELNLINRLPSINDYKVVGVHPGSKLKGELKRWDITKFNKLGQCITERYNFKIRLFLGPEDKDLKNNVNRDFEIIENVQFEEALFRVSECDYFISNDSGLAHVAAAFNIPTIVIFGPTAKTEYILPTKFSAVEIHNLSCRPCFHLRKPCPINQKCLNEISIEQVMTAFENLIC